MGREDLNTSPRDERSAHPPEEFLGFATEHDSGNHFDPTVLGAVVHGSRGSGFGRVLWFQGSAPLSLVQEGQKSGLRKHTGYPGASLSVRSWTVHLIHRSVGSGGLLGMEVERLWPKGRICTPLGFGVAWRFKEKLKVS